MSITYNKLNLFETILSYNVYCHLNFVNCNNLNYFAFPCKRTISGTHPILNRKRAVVILNPIGMHMWSKILLLHLWLKYLHLSYIGAIMTQILCAFYSEFRHLVATFSVSEHFCEKGRAKVHQKKHSCTVMLITCQFICYPSIFTDTTKGINKQMNQSHKHLKFIVKS